MENYREPVGIFVMGKVVWVREYSGSIYKGKISIAYSVREYEVSFVYGKNTQF